MVQHDNPFPALHEVAEIFLAFFIQITGEIVHDHNVVFAAQVVLEGRGAAATGTLARS